MKLAVGPKTPITVLAPAALTSGEMFLLNAFVVCLAGTAASSGAPVSVDTEGVFEVPCLATDVPAQGAKLYFDATNKRLTTTAAGNTLCALCMRLKANGETTVKAWFWGNVV